MPKKGYKQSRDHIKNRKDSRGTYSQLESTKRKIGLKIKTLRLNNKYPYKNIICFICGIEFLSNFTNIKYCKSCCIEARTFRQGVYGIQRKKIKFGNGFHTIKEWQDLCKKWGDTCACCRKIRKLTKDHIIPLSKGGSNGIENIQPLCGSCNSRKNVRVINYGKSMV